MGPPPTKQKVGLLEGILDKLVKKNGKLFRHGIETVDDLRVAQASTFRLEHEPNGRGDFLVYKDIISEANFRVEGGVVALLYGVVNDHLLGQIEYLKRMSTANSLAGPVVSALNLRSIQSDGRNSVILEVPQGISYERTVYDFLEKLMEKR